jgi:tRNA(Ile)-lysidine synthase
MARGKNPIMLKQRVSSFIREHNLASSGSCLLVAVSGGPDSTCLLHLLVRLREEMGIRLHVAHLNHQLRGAESEADAIYVADLAHRLGVPATIEKRDVKAYQKKHRISLEEAAREVRYRFLADIADDAGASRVATGHTLDDHIETILMHLIRGTGIRGLCGLQPCSLLLKLAQNGVNLTIVRPLLEVDRKETADYCQHHRLTPRLDASNLSLSPLRNRIRQQLLPLLKSYNPGVAQALLRTATIATDEIRFWDEEVTRLWPAIVKEQEGVVILDKNGFNALPPALKRHLLRAAIEELLGNLKDIEARHIEEVMAILDKPAGKQISLPGGLIFSIEYNRYLLGPEPVRLCPFPVLDGEFALKIPGETELTGWQVEAEIIERKKITEKGGDFTAYLDLDKAGRELMVRCRKPGDRFQPIGLSQPKKLYEFMIDARIPRAWRRRIPIVFSPQHIVWLAGYRIDERVKVTEDTRQVLRLEFKRDGA